MVEKGKSFDTVAFFKNNPDVKELLKVGDQHFLPSFDNEANKIARASKTKIQIIKRPKR